VVVPTLAKPSFSDLNVSSRAFWSATGAEREVVFRQLRDNEPVSWQRPPEESMIPPEEGAGCWAVTRHEDITTVSRETWRFCSGQGTSFDDIPIDILRRWTSFLAMDAPEHTRIRGAVKSVFTPRQISKIENIMQEQARLIVDDLIEQGSGCDFVENVSVRLPMWISSEMMGVPESERPGLVRASNTMIGRHDEGYSHAEEADPGVALIRALEHMESVGRSLARYRAKNPSNDLMTQLVQAEDDEGNRLAEDEIVSAFCVLTVAGNDTTRNSTSATLKALTDFPDQRQLLLDDFETHQRTALDELFRWATPIPTMRRTATADTRLGDVEIAEGDKVIMFYVSGNWDERAFDHPQRLDLTRSPNRHLAFGGAGPHYCIGSNLGKATLRSILRELLTRLPDIEAGEPRYLASCIVQGIVEMPCTFSVP
jgi:cytochrome P450